jgi:NitT/TauT family transport system ATP-binding protein
MTSLHVSQLSLRYASSLVLSNIEMKVECGEFVSIVGSSGCGKSSLLHAIAGFSPFSGNIVKAGKVGLVMQRHSVFPWMTVKENIAYGVVKNNSDHREIVREHLQMSGLLDKADDYPARLSGGQLQRVAVARALASNPDLLLMDEPFGALDVMTRREMQQWLLKVWFGSGKTVIFVTHVIEEALLLSDKVVVMKEGKLVEKYEVPFPRPRLRNLVFTLDFQNLRCIISEKI